MTAQTEAIDGFVQSSASSYAALVQRSADILVESRFPNVGDELTVMRHGVSRAVFGEPEFAGRLEFARYTDDGSGAVFRRIA